MPDTEVALALRTLQRNGIYPIKEFTDFLREIVKDPQLINDDDLSVECKRCGAYYHHSAWTLTGFRPDRHDYICHYKNCIYIKAKEILEK